MTPSSDTTEKRDDLTTMLAQLEEIAQWFDTHDDVEEGLRKIKHAATLIKKSKHRLKDVENTFNEITNELEEI